MVEPVPFEPEVPQPESARAGREKFERFSFQINPHQVAVDEHGFWMLVEELNNAGNCSRFVHVVRVEPADERSASQCEPLIKGVGLAPIGFRDPAHLRELFQDLDRSVF